MAVSLLAGCDIGVEGLPEGTVTHPPQSVSPGPHHPSGGAHRGHLRFVAGYRQGLRLAATQRKPILIFFTASWCHFCHQMADEAFTDPRVVSLSEQFVCILVDADAEPDVCRHFKVTGYPTVQFLSPQGVQLERVVGKKPGHQVMIAMQAALQNLARRQAGGESTSR